LLSAGFRPGQARQDRPGWVNQFGWWPGWDSGLAARALGQAVRAGLLPRLSSARRAAVADPLATTIAAFEWPTTIIQARQSFSANQMAVSLQMQ